MSPSKHDDEPTGDVQMTATGTVDAGTTTAADQINAAVAVLAAGDPMTAAVHAQLAVALAMTEYLAEHSSSSSKSK
jgi:hypothetical protein